MLVLIKKSMFESKVIEIEGEEFDTEVLNASLPVAVTFWANSCDTCREFVPAMENESTKYSDRIKFVQVNVDDNKQLADRLGVGETPALLIFRDGSVESTNAGNLPADKLAKILDKAATR